MTDTNKEIARDTEEITKVDAQNVKTVCDAYKQILQTVAASNA